ncbi:heme ABC transporter permease [Alcaligenaceae bacterium]|nr:heme ABC transporter permease [Alcaligenaceae bacterium]
MAPIHHLMAHFPVALLFLALLIILIRAFFDTPAIRRIEGVLPLLLILGVAGGMATFVTGLFIWPNEAITSSPMGRNKLLMAAWMLAAWSVVTLLRLRGGPALWGQEGRWPLVLMSLIGGVLLATTGTLGGYLLGSPSRFSDGLRAMGWDVYHTYFAPNWALGVAVVLALVIIGIGFTRNPTNN